MVSSRKESNVQRTVEILKAENLLVDGMVCHVGKAEDRTALIEKVTLLCNHLKLQGTNESLKEDILNL